MNEYRRRTSLALGVAILLSLAGVARAQDDFFRSSPGALSKSHEEIDGQANCNECHDGGKATNDRKCLGCHDHQDLKQRIDAREGFHASNKVRGKKCERCHIEHQGRGFDIRGWPSIEGGEQSFDHRLTGWTLQGKHAAIDCAECHKETNRQDLRIYLGEDKFCGGKNCHAEDTPHESEAHSMLACDRCHTESVWNPQKREMDFDHDDPDDADMPLIGSHEQVACVKCHPKAQFELKRQDPDDCAHCHDSPHDEHLFGLKTCDWCHSPEFTTLGKIDFAHGKRTRFELGGAHSKLDCYDCHNAKLGRAKPDRACESASCHRDDNPHKERFQEFGAPLPRCSVCHPSSSWKPEVFNHNKRTTFELTGKHATIECRQCHRGKDPAQFEQFPSYPRCMQCHQHVNVHDGAFTDQPNDVVVNDDKGQRVKTCLDCHTSGGSMIITINAVRDVHGPEGRWPLVLGHEDVVCQSCHPNDIYEHTPTECGVRCHEDSLHRATLGDACTNCHKAGTWEALAFDHDKDTTFPLIGWHKQLATCVDCHPKREDYHKTPTSCGAAGCHKEDDVHKGKLGDACETCHIETGALIFDHNVHSDYPLTGSHLETQCAECHPSITFKPRPTNCFGCHPEPDVHKGLYGTLCETCHNTTSFAQISALHDVGDFSLDGAHDNQQCVTCHPDSRPLQGMGNLCITCHRQDDIHGNSLSPMCGECHTQIAFAPADFDHTRVGCNLTGLHRVLPCIDCHAEGNFAGLSPTCYGCHADSARRVQAVAPAPDHQAFTTCSICHNPNSWVPAVGSGGVPYGRESICR